MAPVRRRVDIAMTPTILLIQDNPRDASLLRAALFSEAGHDVIWVQTLAAALDKLSTRAVGCVVLDLGLPGGQGLELVDALTRAHPEVPIVVLSGHDDAGLAVEAVRGGAQDYLLKSELAPGVVARAVRYAIERAGIRAELARSEMLYRTVVNSLGEGLIVQGASGQIEMANLEAEKILGLTSDQMLGRTPGDPRWGTVDTNERPLYGERHPAIAAMATGRPVVDVTMGVRRPDGDLRWVEVSSYPMSSAPGLDPWAVVNSVRDVTAKRAALDRMRFQASLLAAAGQSIIATDLTGTVIYWNHAAELMFGWSAEEAMGRDILELTPAEQTADEARLIFAELAAGHSWSGDLLLRRRDGTNFPALITDTPVFDEDGRLKAIIGVSSDITERVRAEEAMRGMSAIVDSSGDAIIGKTMDGTIVSWNRGAERLYGYTAAEVTGRNIRILARDDVADEYTSVLGRVARGEIVERFDTLRRHKDGRLVDVSLTVSPVYGVGGEVVGFSNIGRDITARKQAQRELKHQALHDDLTGLPNRTLLQDRLHQALLRRVRDEDSVAVLFLDLDDFKLVNDSFGHLAGDELLVKVARRLRHTVRPGDTVARFGGDEFVILCEARTTDAATLLGIRILKAIEAPFDLGGREVIATASIGLVIAGDDSTPAGLLQDADTAMYCAKARGRSRVELFDDSLREMAAARLETTTALHRALERDELRVFYQPIVSATDTRPLAVEALIRWEHPERGLVPPDEFIHLAEETGMIIPIGGWVLRKALRERARWQASLPGHPPLRLCVNLSARQLSDPTLVEGIIAALANAGAAPDSLILEITESVLMHDADALSTLHTLRNLGISLHIDDFGTGYSSLAYLKALPVDTLKIDRVFVNGLGRDADDRAIVTAVIALARSLSLAVVAEGVENETQLAVLQELHCDSAQGFLFARPMPYDELISWLRKKVTDGEMPLPRVHTPA